MTDRCVIHPFVEHINATVQDVDRTVRLVTAALPEWRVRGGGTIDWYGRPVRWVHVGSDEHYIALQGGGEGPGPDWRSHQSAIKHVGIVVPSVQAAVERLSAAGFEVDHWGGETAHRRSVYAMAGDDFQIEFVEYRTHDAALRNTYA
jgi:hypothetical protein